MTAIKCELLRGRRPNASTCNNASHSGEDCAKPNGRASAPRRARTNGSDAEADIHRADRADTHRGDTHRADRADKHLVALLFKNDEQANNSRKDPKFRASQRCDLAMSRRYATAATYRA
jgi:hypothetical protein